MAFLCKRFTQAAPMLCRSVTRATAPLSSVTNSSPKLGAKHSSSTLAPITAPCQTHRLNLNRVSSSPWLQRRFCAAKPVSQKKTVTIHFLIGDAKETVEAKVGDNLLDVIVDHDVEIDGYGACEGTLACSTCHLIFTDDQFKKIDEKPADEELDMLDLAFGLTDTSRLGCQVIVTPEMDGWEIVVPDNVADAREP